MIEKYKIGVRPPGLEDEITHVDIVAHEAAEILKKISPILEQHGCDVALLLGILLRDIACGQIMREQLSDLDEDHAQDTISDRCVEVEMISMALLAQNAHFPRPALLPSIAFANTDDGENL